ncbi:MAG: hypothetical protein FE046_02600 [Thermoplasmata archaeon]|nr:MAG: hypothetical protein FE046_02600 [Thermoplasmata archaeon]
MKCQYGVKKEGGMRVAVVECEGCEHASTLVDRECRTNIVQLLMKEGELDRLVLNHPFVKVFEGEPLMFLKGAAAFVEGVQSIDMAGLSAYEKECGEWQGMRDALTAIREMAGADPITAYQQLRELVRKERKTARKKPVILEKKERNDCDGHRRRYLHSLHSWRCLQRVNWIPGFLLERKVIFIICMPCSRTCGHSFSTPTFT